MSLSDADQCLARFLKRARAILLEDAPFFEGILHDLIHEQIGQGLGFFGKVDACDPVHTGLEREREPREPPVGLWLPVPRRW